MNLLLAFLIFLIFYLILEILYRRYQFNPEYSRKFAHLGTGVFGVIVSQVLTRQEFISLIVFFFYFFLISRYMNLLRSIQGVQRKTYGEIAYPLGVLVLALLFYQNHLVFSVGLLILAVADVVAYFVGSAISSSKRTIIGSLAFFLSVMLIMIFRGSIIDAVIFAFVLMLVESVTPLGLDNFTVPVTYTLLTLIFTS